MKVSAFLVRKIILLTFISTACILYTSQAQVLELVKDINTTSFSNSYPFDFNIMNNTLFFIAEGNSNIYELWATSGTEASTQMISPGTSIYGIRDIIVFNNKIYFSYPDNTNGTELWVSDGTAAGTALFKDLYPGSNSSSPYAFSVANNKLFFLAGNADGDDRLYVSDGTAAGTTVIKSNSTTLFNGNKDFSALSNDIYFTSDNGTGAGYGLWKSDGTTAGTVLLKADIVSTSGGNTAVLDNKLYFNSSDNTNGSELWVTDGTAAGTHIVKNLYMGDGGGVYYNGSPYNMKVYNDKLYFSGTDNTNGTELFVTDGTDVGTHAVKDIVPGKDGSFPSEKMVYNGFLYFSCGGDSAGLYKTDGTAAGTVSVKTGLFNTHFADISNGKLFIVLGPSDNHAVWQTDGTASGTIPVYLTNTSNPVSCLSDDFKFKEYNSSLYLCAFNGDVTAGYELCRITGSALPLHLLSFTAKTENDKDILSWVTAGEVNTASFSIQRSADGTIFSSIGNVNASGSSAVSSSYNFSYPSASNPAVFYRLQMIDNDGKLTYSQVIKLNRHASSSITAKYISVNKQITITNNSTAACNWRLISINGSLVKQGNSSDPLIHINTAGLTAGVYFVSLEVLNETVNTKIVIF